MRGVTGFKMMRNVHHDRESDSETSGKAGTMLILDSPAVSFVLTFVITNIHIFSLP